MMQADEILARWPETALVADVIPVRYRAIPSPAIGFPDWKALAALCGQLVADHPDLAGIVIGHGTATLEETAYFLNLTVKVSVPVVVVGSQRPSSALSSDAGMNLVNAIRVAASPEARGMGVLVVLNDEIHAAREVTKTSTLAPADLPDPGFRRSGPCRRRRRRVLSASDPPPRARYRVRHCRRSRPCRGSISPTPTPVATASRHGPSWRRAHAASSPPGSLRVSARPDEIEALTEAARQGIVVVQCTRAGSGRTYRSAKLRDAGFLIADNLNPQKARILLALALTVTSDPETIMRMFRTY